MPTKEDEIHNIAEVGPLMRSTARPPTLQNGVYQRADIVPLCPPLFSESIQVQYLDLESLEKIRRTA